MKRLSRAPKGQPFASGKSFLFGASLHLTCFLLAKQVSLLLLLLGEEEEEEANDPSASYLKRPCLLKEKARASRHYTRRAVVPVWLAGVVIDITEAGLVARN